VDADIVVPVPDSGVGAAIGYAAESGLSSASAWCVIITSGAPSSNRNRNRHFGVKIKLNPVRDLIEGRRVVLIDDSLVRGTTSKKIVKMGARWERRKFTCDQLSADDLAVLLRVDTPTREELIGAQKSVAEICEFIGADSLGYLSMPGCLKLAAIQVTRDSARACYTGRYPTPLGQHVKP